ncbi:hypothetical protein LTS15_010933 [Exophiala xenobiotica]|nr:hypothetical protein LTS15_010933 [Exophiala xenobiotica]
MATSSSDFTSRLKPAPPDGAATIKQERARSDLDADKLGQHLHGKTYLQRQQRILAIIVKDKLFDKSQQANLSRQDRYKLGLARGKRLRQLQDVHGWDDEDFLMAEYLVDDVQPYHLHISLFTAAIREQSNDEQRAYWMPKLASWEIIGAYAQTELGHGSNVRGIETEARWDPQSQQFILHSPYLTASQWWNGTLGRTATHAVVIAQLMLPEASHGGDAKYESYGPHPFIVQVRDMRTHQPPSSIIVGDIGPKYGYAPMDNAIPHSALLARYSKLDPHTGAYNKSNNPSSLYGQLTRGRSFHDRDDADKRGPETSVLDYPTVQIRILPLLATTFALHFSGQAMRQLYERTRNSSALDGDRVSEDADLATLTELHSTSAGLKSLTTELAANGIESCRRAMGGHGYGGGTGLVQLNADYLSKPTVEGDNWMITQQVAQYLIKKVNERSHSLKSQALNKTEEHLKDYLYSRVREPKFEVLEDKEGIVQAFNWRMSWSAFRAYDAREVQRRPWNSLLIEFHRLSRAYSQAMLVSNFYGAISSSAMGSLEPTTRTALTDLFRLFALHTMDTEAREFQNSGAVSSDTLDQLSDTVLALMSKIRPHAVKLVDAWALPDYLLDSALGRYDGRVYEDLFHRAHVLNPLNKVTFNPDYRNNEIVMGSGDAGQIQAKL